MLNRLTAKATGLQVLTGSSESATVGNFAIQLAALDGNYTDGIGVTAKAVAEWAGILAAQPIDCSWIRGNASQPNKVGEVRSADWKGTGMTDKLGSPDTSRARQF